MEDKSFSAGEHGLVGVKSAAGVVEEQVKAKEEAKALASTAAVKASDLSSYVSSVFEENRNYRDSEGIEAKLLDSLRRRMGEYSPEKLQAIQKQGGSAVFAEVTGVKCRNAESWLADVFSPNDEKSWALKPTPVTELPADAEARIQELAAKFAQKKMGEAAQQGGAPTQQQGAELTLEATDVITEYVKREQQDLADDRARSMEALMYDQLLEAEWDKALDAFIFDLATLKAAIMKGPVIRMRKNRRWQISEDGTSELVIERTPQPVFVRVSPFDFYPSPLADSAEGPGPMVEKLWLTRTAIQDMKEMDGYDEKAIDRVLSSTEEFNQPPAGTDSLIRDRLALENKGGLDDVAKGADTLFGLEFHGAVQGRLLLDHGLKEDNDGKALRNNTEYSVEILQIKDELIYVSLNPDKLGRHPYSSTSWSKMAGAFWGEGVPELLHSVQDICNASLRALVNNMGFASGPQMVVTDIDRVPDNEDLTEVYPFKMWQFTNERNMTTDPVKFTMVPSNATELYAVYENFKKQADDDSGIPAYVYGNERVAGAGRALANHEPLITPEGLVPIGDIKVGDLVAGTTGKFTEVLGVYPQGMSSILRMTFSNGQHVDCDANHRWSVSANPERPDSFKTLTTKELLAEGLFCSTEQDERNPEGLCPKWALPKVAALEYPAVGVKIDPYTMGAVHKDIPIEYLRNTLEVRWELLRGLMDTEGCASSDGDHVFFCTSSEAMRDSFITLVKSLGATSVSAQSDKGGEAYRVLFDLGDAQVFHLERKQSQVKRGEVKSLYITGVEAVADELATCITVAAENSLFLCGNFIPTHNTASGLSMLMTGASRGIKKVIRNMHRDMIRPSLERLYDWNMQFVDDPSIKGDAEIQAVGAVAILAREQAATRRLELLQATNNPTDLKLFGIKNRAELWRETLDTLEFDGGTLVLTDVELEKIEEQEQAMAQGAQQAEQAGDQAEQQIKQGELEVKKQTADQNYDIELRKLDHKGSELDVTSDGQTMQAADRAATQEIQRYDKIQSAKAGGGSDKPPKDGPAV